jgi:short-subunit dehydrogenase
MTWQEPDRNSPVPDITPYALVTGPTSGIGYALADLLAKDGVNLVLTSRNETRLQEVKTELEDKYSVNVKIIPRDLAQPGAPSEIFAILKQEGLQLSILVNNAGYNVYGRFEESDLEQELKMIQLHIGSVTESTKLFLRQRARDATNKILNVSSIAALVPGPRVSVHFATRAHVLSFSLALADEFRGTDVSVTCLCPGPVRTDFYNRASMVDVRLASGKPIRMMDAQTVAAIGYDAMKNRKVMVVPGLQNKLLALLAKFAPRSLATRFTRWVMDCP